MPNWIGYTQKELARSANPTVKNIMGGIHIMAKNKVFKTMDGNEAAAYVSYAFTEVATIYPITPSSPMADHVD